MTLSNAYAEIHRAVRFNTKLIADTMLIPPYEN